MSYFSKFPKTLYSFDFKNSSPAVVTNIFSRVKLRSEVVKNAYAQYKYQLQDGDTPEIVSFKEYGDPSYHWVVCFVNNLIDPHFDFPLDNRSLENKIIAQYGYSTIDEAIANNHHYELNVDRVLAEVYGPTTTTNEKFIVTLDQYNYRTSQLETNVLNNPTTVTTQFRSNNADPLSAVTSTLSITSTYKPVSVYDYEIQLNEDKRQINLLKIDYIAPLIEEFNVVLNG